MIIVNAALKGGVGKSTTTVALADYLSGFGRTLALDADTKAKSLTDWAKRGGPAFPFRVAPSTSGALLAASYEHVVMDMGQGPSVEDFQGFSESGDLLIVPTVPGGPDTDALMLTIDALQKINCQNYRVLLTRVKPQKVQAAVQIRELLASMGVPVFASQISELEAYDKASTEGTTVRLVKHKLAKRAWQAYVAVGKEILV